MKIRNFYWFFPAALIVTALCGLMYILVQQNMRQSTNDPQIQMAEDIAKRLSRGQAISAISFPDAIDMSQSLGLFVSIYDDNGQPVASTAYLGGQIPKVPIGSLLYAKTHGQNRVTWQPRAGVRAAIVATPYENSNSRGYVVVGRSLREVEKRVDYLTQLAIVGWLIIVVASFVSFQLIPTQQKR